MSSEPRLRAASAATEAADLLPKMPALSLIQPPAALPHPDRRIRIIIAFMTENIGRKLTINDLADHLRLCPRQLERMFLTECGSTPMKFLHALRLEKACHLLVTTDQQIKQIAIETGMSQSYFVREFRKVWQQTPAEYREDFHRAVEGHFTEEHVVFGQ